MENHRAREAGQGGRRVRIGITRVDDDSDACCRRDLELAIEELTLDRTWCEIVEVVETRLPDRDGPRMAEQLDELIGAGSLRATRLMRIDPDSGVDALLGRGDRERGVTRGNPRPDRDDARDADCPRPFDEERGGLVAAVEMGVGVDHGIGYAAGSSRRGNSGGAASIPCVSAVRP